MPWSCRDRARFAAVLCAGVACCAPAAASGPPGPGTGGAQMPAQIAPSIGVSGYGAPGRRSVLVAPTALVGEVVVVRGTFPGAARRHVVLQRLDPRRGWGTVARTRVHSTGRLVARWRADRSGRIGLRVVRRRRAGAADAAPVAYVDVYRPARATFYGAGLYGNRTYCGQLMTPLLLGVAHRRLPCGTQVAILYDRREIVVPVVDRGPFAAGYAWDLTQATADALGFTASGAIGYVRVQPPPA
ncbi:MAG: rare lipoprotein [Solirubrobacteraceae bacterium]|nr:rare lipoprotein [Solirubrobacteraceae bacterium]